jgi:hypothetical protein
VRRLWVLVQHITQNTNNFVDFTTSLILKVLT